MNSKGSPKEAYVWLWLPGETEPVVAGRLARADDGVLVFNYGQSYLARSNAIPIYEPELPLRAGELPLLNGLQMPNCIRDASPDAWGRRVLLYRAGARADNVAELDELTYLLESGSDRIGALDFQSSPTEYVPRAGIHTPMHELMEAAQRIQDGLPVSQALDLALRHGTSIGGARPKVTLEEAGKKYIAKFSSNKDLYNVVKAEFVAMRLAALCSINTATVRLEVSGKLPALYFPE